MNKIQKGPVQDAYSFQQIHDLLPLKKQFVNFLTIVYENSNRDEKYSINLTEALKRELNFSTEAAKKAVSKMVRIGFIERTNNRLKYRYAKDRTIPNIELANNLFRIRHIKVRKHEISEAFEKELPKDSEISDEELFNRLRNTEIFCELTSRGYTLKLYKLLEIIL